MPSRREEEKELRRQERLAEEQAAARRQARSRRIWIVGGTILAAVVIAGIAVALTAGGEDSAKPTTVRTGPQPPGIQERDLDAAVRTAGCRMRQVRSEGRDHVERDVAYKSNPPTSGPHAPQASQDGNYAGIAPPDLEGSVHALEHGRINFQYRRGTPRRRILQLRSMFEEEVQGVAGYHSLVFENQTGMPFAVAATAWTRSLECERFTDTAFDALRAFREKYVDKGPEFIP